MVVGEGRMVMGIGGFMGECFVDRRVLSTVA